MFISVFCLILFYEIIFRRSISCQVQYFPKRSVTTTCVFIKVSWYSKNFLIICKNFYFIRTWQNFWKPDLRCVNRILAYLFSTSHPTTFSYSSFKKFIRSSPKFERFIYVSRWATFKFLNFFYEKIFPRHKRLFDITNVFSYFFYFYWGSSSNFWQIVYSLICVFLDMVHKKRR